MTVSDPFEVIRDAARSHMLAVKNVGEGEYFFSSPLRSDSDPSVHVTRKNGKTLVADMSDPTDRRLVEETLQALGIPDVFKSADHDCGYSDMSDMERIAALAARNRKASSHSPATAKIKEPARLDRLEKLTPYVQASASPVYSDEFRRLCALLHVEPAPGLIRATCPACGEEGTLRMVYSPLNAATLMRCNSLQCAADLNGLADVLRVEPDRRYIAKHDGMTLMDYDRNDSQATYRRYAGGSLPFHVRYVYPDGSAVWRGAHGPQAGDGEKPINSAGTGGRRPLYQGDNAKKWALAGEPVFLVEGEKDAATLWGLGYAAVSGIGGGGSFADRLDLGNARDVLAGADVIAVVDKDETGRKWREQVEKTIRPIAGDLTMVQATGDAHDTTDAVMMGEWFEILPDPTPAGSISLPTVETDEEEDEGAFVPPATDPYESFWRSRPFLEKIRDAARQSLVSPWATLMCVLARVATRIPPQVVTPRIVGGYGSLNCFVGLIGEAGKGKDAADVVASMLVPDIRGANTIMPASGEGVAAMFAYKGKPSDDGDAGERDVTCCCNSRAYLRISEVSQLGALMGRQGSTLGPELTKLWSGQLIGTLTKDPAKRLYAPAFGYRAAMYVGIQPGNAGVILDEEATGLPQRFLWADTSDYWPISEEDVIRGYEPDPLPLGDMPEEPTGLQDLYKAKGRENMLNGGETNYPLTVIEYPDKVIRETRANRRRVLTSNTFAPPTDRKLDTHSNLTRIRTAALIAFLDTPPGQMVEVSEEHWALAGEIMKYSRAQLANLLKCRAMFKRKAGADKEKDRRISKAMADKSIEADKRKARTRILAFMQNPSPKYLKNGEADSDRWARHEFTGIELKQNTNGDARGYVYGELLSMAEEKPPLVEVVQQGTGPGSTVWKRTGYGVA